MHQQQHMNLVQTYCIRAHIHKHVLLWNPMMCCRKSELFDCRRPWSILMQIPSYFLGSTIPWLNKLSRSWINFQRCCVMEPLLASGSRDAKGQKGLIYSARFLRSCLLFDHDRGSWASQHSCLIGLSLESGASALTRHASWGHLVVCHGCT